MKTLLPLALALSLAGCISLAPKPPASLLTLTPAATGGVAGDRTAAPGQTISVATPIVPESLQTERVPVQASETSIAYLQDARWVATPDRLFGRLLSDVIAARTGRVVLDALQLDVSPGVRLTGRLDRFGIDAASSEAVVAFEAAVARDAGAVVTRRFEARVPVAAVDVVNAGPALNQAANTVAVQVADWVGGLR